jgi:hypothetical protein
VVVDTTSPKPYTMAEGGLGARATWIVDVGTSGAGNMLELVLVLDGGAENGAAEVGAADVGAAELTS